MFESLLARIALALERSGVAYMVIGGQAVLLYGEPRLTRDIDITVGADSTKLDFLLDVIREAGLIVAVKDLPQFVKATNVVPALDEPSGIRVDFIFSFSEYEQAALARVKTVRLGDGDVRFAAVEDLLIHKLVAARPRDMDDVRGILSRKPALDEIYLKRWLKELSLALGRDLAADLDKLTA